MLFPRVLASNSMSALLSQFVSQSLTSTMSQSIAPSATQPTTSVSSAVTPGDGTGVKQTSDDEDGECFVLIAEGRFYRELYFALDEESTNNRAFDLPSYFLEIDVAKMNAFIDQAFCKVHSSLEMIRNFEVFRYREQTIIYFSTD